jgi:hypothetical protein
LGALKRLFGETIDLNSISSMIDEAPFGHASGARGRKRMLPPELALATQQRLARLKPPKTPAIQTLLQRAYQLKTRLADESGMTRSQLARHLGLDPSRVTQILNLMKLAPKIQRYIKTLAPTKHHSLIGDEEWMRLARLPDHMSQMTEFERLLAVDTKNFTKASRNCLVRELFAQDTNFSLIPPT